MVELSKVALIKFPQHNNYYYNIPSLLYVAFGIPLNISAITKDGIQYISLLIALYFVHPLPRSKIFVFLLKKSHQKEVRSHFDHLCCNWIILGPPHLSMVAVLMVLLV